jgi:anti-sigma factor RsiW
MKECLSEEILQQYFDGELPSVRMESVALHLAGCESCSSVLREMEGETNLLMSALAPEFDVVVPTERLHQRIQAAIADVSPAHLQPVASSRPSQQRGWFTELAAIFSLSSQRALGYASLVAVLAFAAIYGIALRGNKSVPSTPSVAGVVTPKDAKAPQSGGAVAAITPDVKPVETTKAGLPPKSPPAKGYTAKLSRRVPVPNEVRPATEDEIKLLPGERSYLKTIAELDTTIKSGNKTMRPALQAEYERNLALVDRAIAATRTAAKRNPNDPDAVEFMFSAYQSKVDLLNTIADARVYNKP